MHFKDSLRAQFYLSSLEKSFLNTISTNTRFSALTSEAIFSDFLSELCCELDQILLPTIVYELHKTKSQGLLNGSTPTECYNSFFIKEGRYTSEVRSIIDKYPFLFEMLDNVIHCSMHNLDLCISRFQSDIHDIYNHFSIDQSATIEKIKILSSSDRHRNQQSLLIHLSDGAKLVYKPVDLRPDGLLQSYIDIMDFQHPFDLKTRKVLARVGYGWLEFIPTSECNTYDEIENYFKRMGVVLAISDNLNYSDGHNENILASGAYPILLDVETLFQNYTMPISERKSIISTHIIQKFLKRKNNSVIYSALQSDEKERYESLHTHALNDRTTDIQISYSGYTDEINHNRPSLGGVFFSSHQFIEEVIAGYCYAYKRITEQSLRLIQKSDWWTELSKLNSRMVLRNTGTYFYLQRMIQQPKYARSKSAAEVYVKYKLGDSIYTKYETVDILNLNIPYFYQSPGAHDLYDGNGNCYKNVFPATAIEWLKKQLSQRSEEKMHHDCKIIRTYLPKKLKKLKYELI